MKRAKPFEISKKVVWEAWKRVKANHGAAGVDEESIADFEKDLKNNLYKIWNRMSSGMLLSSAGQNGRDTEEEWRRKTLRDTHGF